MQRWSSGWSAALPSFRQTPAHRQFFLVTLTCLAPLCDVRPGKGLILPPLATDAGFGTVVASMESMTFDEVTNLIRWQWSGYGATHQSKANLLIDIIAVPLFMTATVIAVFALVSLSFSTLVLSLLGLVLSLLIQRIGHTRKPQQPEPFHGGVDFASRILIEQWITFPRFVLTGGWFKNLSQSGMVEK